MRVVRTDQEIDEVLDLAHQGSDEGSKWPGMSYEDGIIALAEWLFGQTDIHPMSDEE